MSLTLLTLLLAAPGADPVCTPQRPAETVATRVSKYDSVTTKVGTATVKVCYSRPLVNKRAIFGSELVPWGKLWRTGANEPTIIHTTGPIVLAGVPLAAGSYSFYTVPKEKSPWEVVLNRSITQWGIESAYDAVKAQEISPRGSATTSAMPQPVEAFTISFMTGMMHLAWDKTMVNLSLTAGK